MSRCKLGNKKHKKCEEITGKKYETCLVRGGNEHFWAACVYKEDGKYKADWVNYKTSEWESEEEDSPRINVTNIIFDCVGKLLLAMQNGEMYAESDYVYHLEELLGKVTKAIID